MRSRWITFIRFGLGSAIVVSAIAAPIGIASVAVLVPFGVSSISLFDGALFGGGIGALIGSAFAFTCAVLQRDVVSSLEAESEERCIFISQSTSNSPNPSSQIYERADFALLRTSLNSLMF
jgi:hypothetical protein